MDHPDILVVGAGSAGCALAARLPGRVLLLEAGPLDLPAEPAASLDATLPGHPRNWAYDTELRPGRPAVVPRGRGLGGSGAINGANWVWATPADAADWAQPGWSWPELAACFRAAETDLDHPGGSLHGHHGPIPVRRPAPHPASDRFLAAALALGFPAEPDKNAGAAPGAGPVPANAVDGVRIDPATAYLPADRVTVRGDAPVARVVFDGDRAVGVRLLDGTVLEAGEVVLSAGAVATPQLLMLSGVGPADELRALGIPVLADLPVGRAFTDHPAVYLPFGDTDPPAQPDDGPGSRVGLDVDLGSDPAGDGEVLLFVRPFVAGGPLHLMCQLLTPDSRGTIALTSADPRARPSIRYGYLRTERDRRRLRHVVRTAAELLRAGAGTRIAPGGDVLGNDRALDGWIAGGLTTAVHLSGSAPLGPVLDPQLRVHGLRGLRVADTSILPTVPRRGTAATAVAIGERAAQLIASRS